MGFGAFLDGLTEGMTRRREWDRQDQLLAWDREDRQIAAEDRERRRAREDANWRWEDNRRERTQMLESREDAQFERAQADYEQGRSLLADAFPGSDAGAATIPTPSAPRVPAAPEGRVTGDEPASEAPTPRTTAGGEDASTPPAEPAAASAPPPDTPQEGRRLEVTPASVTVPEAPPPPRVPAEGPAAPGRTEGRQLSPPEATGPALPPRADELGAPPPEVAGQMDGPLPPPHIDAPYDPPPEPRIRPHERRSRPGDAPQGDGRALRPRPAPAAPPEARAPRTADVAPDAPVPTVEAVANPASPEAAAATTAAAERAATETPSAQIGAEVAAEEVAGREVTPAPDGRNITYLDEGTIDRIGRNFQTSYNEAGVRRLEEHYLRIGDVESAQRLRDFITGEDTQRAIYHFGRAQAAAAIGDAERFLGEMAAIYNAPQYYDDGYTVDLARSQVFRDDAGDFQGVAVAFVNDDTGEVFMREIASEDDLYSIGLGLAAPETVFERWNTEYQTGIASEEAQVAAWETAQREAIIAEAVAQSPAQMRAEFNEMFQFLYEQAGEIQFGQEEGTNFRSMTPQQQASRVIELLQAREAAVTGRSLGPAPPGASSEVPLALTP